ncbi:nucleotidyltransferase domain-containing protein [Streptomyces sp. NPDC017993]|uniref:nucleotidyltransferase domain-containing protein n=1 Tax=Streptomyces sp. NPDC017993 TaxID=3365027 RepID=UPI00379A62D7
MRIADPVAAARDVVRAHHPHARAAFLGGSAPTARRTHTSDLDIVVVLGGDPAPSRHSFRHAGWPVELFAHTERTWRAFIERETAARRSPLLWMCAAGVLLHDGDGIGERLAEEARARAAAGPPPVTAAELDDRRYALTDLLDDLAGCAADIERLFVVTELARRTGELVLLRHGAWLSGGKWLARRLEDVDPGFPERLRSAVRAALDGGSGPLVALVDEALRPVGGRLREGYHRQGTP